MERELERLHASSWGWSLACCARDRALAEDVLQTAYLRILSARARFSGASTFKTWVFGVIRLTAVEALRRQKGQFAREVGAEALAHLPAVTASTDTIAESAARREALVAALHSLSPRQREVLQLVFYHEMTIEEAAAVMKVSIGSARTHYERGKRALAREIVDGATL